MIKTKKKEFTAKNIWLMSAGVLIILMVFIFFYWAGPGGIKENIELKKRIEVLDREVKELAKSNSALEKEILRMKSSPEYLVEKIAREELEMKKENERIVYFEKKEKDDNKDSQR